MNPLKPYAVIGAFFMALGVIAGAFGAHVIRERLPLPMLAVYEKGVLYHLIHGIAVLLVVSISSFFNLNEKRARLICTLFCIGIILFSGSLYLLALTGERRLGAITPLGGVSFIVAWWLLAYSVGSNKT